MEGDGGDLDELVARWRDYRRRRAGLPVSGLEGLERRLREEAAGLLGAGLTVEEAFMVSVRRLARQDPASGDFGREFWRGAADVAAADVALGRAGAAGPDMAVAFVLAVAAAVAIKIPAMLGYPLFGGFDNLYILNLSLFVLPMVAGYFVWRRGLGLGGGLGVGLPFLAAAAVVNGYPFDRASVSTAPLAGIHLPVALWLAVGVAYTGGRWAFGGGQWMEFVRFSGEFVIYYVLIALGGGALAGLSWALFDAIGVDASGLVGEWVLPCGAMGAGPICAWLVEGRRRVMGNIAPMLARVFTPLVAALLAGFLATMAVTGRGISAEREVLIAFDLLLVLVLGLLLYSVSSRSPEAPPGVLDWLTALLCACALIADAAALAAIAARIGEFGFSPNKITALGENLILLVNLAWALVLYARFVRGGVAFVALERWQTGYLPVFAVWAAVVVVAFPPLFGYA